MYAGVVALSFCAAVSPSHDWSEKTIATLEDVSHTLHVQQMITYHPIILNGKHCVSVAIHTGVATSLEEY